MNEVINSKLSGIGVGMDLNRMGGSRKQDGDHKGALLPLFSNLGHVQSYWINKIAEAYKEDMNLFGYDYLVEDNGQVYAFCKAYDNQGMCMWQWYLAAKYSLTFSTLSVFCMFYESVSQRLG